MRKIILKARAKINLTLDVIDKRNDGYHNVNMIMQNISLYDTVLIKKIRKNDIILKSNINDLPSDERNIAYKAALLMKENFKIKEGIFIKIYKRIPISAGLAGGSSDCAAVLVGINKLFNLELNKKQLMDIGVKLGADVPYCIMRGTALAQGIGEKLKRLNNCPYMYVILLKPDISISTADVYNNIKLHELDNCRPNTKKVIECIRDNNKYGLCSNVCNVLENVTLKMYPKLIEYKKRLILKGAVSSLMSGSGPTIYGLFFDKTLAIRAYREFIHEGDIKDVIFTDIYTIIKK